MSCQSLQTDVCDSYRSEQAFDHATCPAAAADGNEQHEDAYDEERNAKTHKCLVELLNQIICIIYCMKHKQKRQTLFRDIVIETGNNCTSWG